MEITTIKNKQFIYWFFMFSMEHEHCGWSSKDEWFCGECFTKNKKLSPSCIKCKHSRCCSDSNTCTVYNGDWSCCMCNKINRCDEKKKWVCWNCLHKPCFNNNAAEGEVGLFKTIGTIIVKKLSPRGSNPQPLNVKK